MIMLRKLESLQSVCFVFIYICFFIRAIFRSSLWLPLHLLLLLLLLMLSLSQINNLQTKKQTRIDMEESKAIATQSPVPTLTDPITCPQSEERKEEPSTPRTLLMSEAS